MNGRYLFPLLCLSSLAAQTPNLSKVVDTYCGGCHNGQQRSPSGALLDKLRRGADLREPGSVVAGLPPASGGHDAAGRAPRPDRATYDAVLASIEQGLGATAAKLSAKLQPTARRSPHALAPFYGTARPMPLCFRTRSATA